MGTPLACNTNILFGLFSQDLCDIDSTLFDLYVAQTIDIKNLGRSDVAGSVQLKLTIFNLDVYKIYMQPSSAYQF
jgi:hypothetical protein